MTLSPAYLVLLCALLVGAALLHSPWWGLALIGLLAWLAFDGYARGSSRVQDGGGGQMPDIDLFKARIKSYVIEDFFSGAIAHASGGAIIGSWQDARAILQACRLPSGTPDPRRLAIVSAMQLSCADCSHPTAENLANLTLSCDRSTSKSSATCVNCGSPRIRFSYVPGETA